MTRRRCARVALTITGAALLTIATSVLPAGADLGAKPVLPAKDEVKLLTKTAGVGPHPVLRWSALKGASRYVVVVGGKKGAPYWTWNGAENRVRLGGGPEDAPRDSDGASLVRKQFWFVVAFDAEGALVGASARRPIAP